MRFWVTSREEEPCAYLPGRIARNPLRLPLQPVGREAFDALLAEGDRRAGPFLYRPSCAACAACEPLRIPVARFAPTRSQRKVRRRNRDVEVTLGPARADEERVALFNRHKLQRGLAAEPSSVDAYAMQFVESCVDTREIAYRAGGRLLAVSILDLGLRAASSVYHYFDPAESRRSLGVFSVLAELELCAALGLEWYYLGLYVEGCKALRYKAEYLPHQRLSEGAWRDAPPDRSER